ncbi:hypothetical protein NU08_3526 [Flavobacterium anhuiense]|uniref:Uncharacterized protein n=2 Tax=Flavobacterium anhuiense TaxID=459526 RepID=A0A444VW19_9FLAO|nr:hypothetical protein NU08_3526 [Flavobacterium anhuiense]
MNLMSVSSKYNGLFALAFCFSIPAISVLISIFFSNIPYKKEFRYFSIFLVVISIIAFVTFSYLGALGKAYQH